MRPDKKRIRYSSGALALLMVCAAASQAKLQIFERSSTIEKAQETNRFTLRRPDPAKRGTIYSSDLKPLAQDSQTFNLNVQFKDLPKSSAFFMDLAKATAIPASEFASFAESGAKSKTWMEPLNDSQREQIQDLRARWRASGVSVTPAKLRDYPLGDAASCLIGTIKEYKEGTIRSGLEGRENKVLSGQDGLRIGLTDRTGAFLPMRMEDQAKTRVDGKDLTLTIDSEIQAATAAAVKKKVEETKADSGTAIVMVPQTGDLLAMVNYPSYDPNINNKGEIGFNSAYMAPLEPGSMFKLLTLAEALETGKATMSSTINCPGYLHPTPSSIIHCDKGEVHHTITSAQAIEESCNISAATWAMRIGRPNMLNFIDKLGILQKTSLNLPAESQGLFRRDEYAKVLQLAHVGFGQSITATPLGLASAFSLLGNDGVRMEPRLIKKIGNQEVPLSPGVRVVSPEVAHDVSDAMVEVLEGKHGTGKSLRIDGYRIGGKTGTAQKIGAKEKGHVSNFIAFVPADKPRAMILVMINNPHTRNYYGAQTAGPVFREIALSLIRRMNIPPDESFRVARK